jgi:hypothetical protein
MSWSTGESTDKTGVWLFLDIYCQHSANVTAHKRFMMRIDGSRGAIGRKE